MIILIDQASQITNSQIHEIMNPIHNLPLNEELFQNSPFSKSPLEIDNVEKVDRGYPVKNNHLLQMSTIF